MKSRRVKVPVEAWLNQWFSAWTLPIKSFIHSLQRSQRGTAMTRWRWFRFLAFPTAAVLCALVGNALAPAQRHLAWSGWVPPSAATAPTPRLPDRPEPAPARSEPTPEQPAPTPTLPARPEPALARPDSTPAKPLPAPGSAPMPSQWRPDPGAPIRDLGSDQAWAAFQRRIPFLDARRSDDFRAGHLAGAFSVPVWEAVLEGRITEFEARAQPDPAQPIVLYCSGGDCEDSRLLARKLVALGYRNLLIYRDGYPDWVAKHRPVAMEVRP
jgi:rhodanese-related sulfurtransferase